MTTPQSFRYVINLAMLLPGICNIFFLQFSSSQNSFLFPTAFPFLYLSVVHRERPTLRFITVPSSQLLTFSNNLHLLAENNSYFSNNWETSILLANALFSGWLNLPATTATKCPASKFTTFWEKKLILEAHCTHGKNLCKIEQAL